MTNHRPAPPARRTRSWIGAVAVVVALVVASATMVGVLTRQPQHQGWGSSAPTGSRLGTPVGDDQGVPDPSRRQPPRAPTSSGGASRTTVLGTSDGAVPEGTTVFDDDVPAVARLDHGLLGKLREAAAAAAADRVVFHVNSGWRSPAYQDQLLRQAIAEYGSKAEAARWVATADTSPHVSGDAVDLGRPDTTAWLSRHGAAYGLCQIYRNEPWHYELRPAAVDGGCPPLYADPTHDPRMRR